MRVAWAAWVQGLLGLAKAALFVTFGPTRLAAARAEVIKRAGGSESLPLLPGLFP